MKQKSSTGSSLAEWRQQMGLTQRDLANLAKVSQGHISEAENLRADLSEKLRKFLEAAGEGAIAAIEQHKTEVSQRQEEIKRELLTATAPATANTDQEGSK
jgi:transcriptional regulator with XRE-family HTH domain